MATHRFHSRLDRLIALWILRVFSQSLGRSVFLNNSGYTDSDIAEFLGLPLRLDEATIREIPRMLDDLQISLEKARPASLPAVARDNFTRFPALLACGPIVPPVHRDKKVSTDCVYEDQRLKNQKALNR
jgi:hypothetical protein